MSWWATIPTLAATLVVFFVPGLLILAAAGVRRLNLVALAAPVSTSVSACLAIVLPYAGLPFNPVSYFVFSILAAAGALLARFLLMRRSASGKSRTTRSRTASRGALGGNGRLLDHDYPRWIALLAVPVAVIFPAIIIAGRYISAFGSPENFSQTFDNVYHLNAIRHIAETQNGSTLTLGNLTDASQALYPAAMHDSMALVLMLGAPSVMAVVNVGTIVTGALVWPLACIFLISRIIGYRPIPLLCAGVLCAGFSGFPYLMVAFGVLYPNHAAIALLPVVLGLLIEAVGMSRARPLSTWPAAIALVATLPGLGLSHPSTAVALLGFGGPVVVARLIRAWLSAREGSGSRRAVYSWLAYTAGYILVVVLAWITVRPSLAFAPWTPFQSNARAIGEILGSAPMGATTAWILLILTVIGLYVIARQLRTYWWVAAMYGVGGILYMVVSSWSLGAFRTFLTGVWYNDSFRLAALLPVVTLPVIVLGAEWLAWRVRALYGLLTSQHSATATRRPSIVGRAARLLPHNLQNVVPVALILLLGFGTQGGTLAGVQDRMREVFATTAGSPLLTEDEIALLERVDDYVPETDVIVANPRTGASLVYAFSSSETIAPHIFGERTPEEQTLLDHWGEAAYNTSVCPAVNELNAYWALDFGNQEIVPGEEPFIGLRDLIDETAPGVELVAEEGDARLFRMTACS
ncbi:DUF6541 family protein [Arthrobacter sp. H41]|uniref:DUF6541 family protein n=1 Tax=Arthrobacter sp. H41 TaxID=1312978 RepID=UPI00047AB667|nr:DUF6541 family protein [Arthrobacter sp. H41]